VERRHCPSRLPEQGEGDSNSIRSLAPLMTQARRLRNRARGRGMGTGWEMEVQVRSYYRAHRESVRRRVLVLRGPLAPDTDRHHRRIREKVVGCRTDGCAGRDEKDVGVRSCSCGVAVWLRRKVLLEWLTGTADITHGEIRNLILFGMARYESCARARMVLSIAGIVQQHLNGMVPYVECPACCFGFQAPSYLCFYDTEAGSGQPFSPQAWQLFVGFETCMKVGSVRLSCTTFRPLIRIFFTRMTEPYTLHRHD
jgi:hypothetical protein